MGILRGKEMGKSFAWFESAFPLSSSVADEITLSYTHRSCIDRRVIVLTSLRNNCNWFCSPLGLQMYGKICQWPDANMIIFRIPNLLENKSKEVNPQAVNNTQVNTSRHEQGEIATCSYVETPSSNWYRYVFF